MTIYENCEPGGSAHRPKSHTTHCVPPDDAPVRVFDIEGLDSDGTIRALFRRMDRETRQIALAHLFATMPPMQEGWYGACDALVAEIDELEAEQEWGGVARQLAVQLIDRARANPG